MQNTKGLIIVISGPSGGGKTTVIEHLLSSDPQLSVAISATTRPKRPGEIDGQDYYFIDQHTFKQHLASQDFVEYAQIYDNFYGTLRSEIERLQNQGKDIMFNKDYQGMIHLKSLYRIISIFLTPPSFDVLAQRLTARSQDSDEVIQQRLSQAFNEMAYAPEYDYVVCNDNFQQCLQEVRDIINKERLNLAH